MGVRHSFPGHNSLPSYLTVIFNSVPLVEIEIRSSIQFCPAPQSDQGLEITVLLLVIKYNNRGYGHEGIVLVRGACIVHG